MHRVTLLSFPTNLQFPLVALICFSESNDTTDNQIIQHDVFQETVTEQPDSKHVYYMTRTRLNILETIPVDTSVQQHDG